MALRVKAENVPVKKVVLNADQGQGSMVVKQAYGNESSLMMATRPPGYHTKPHMHVSEQINHVMEGEIWFFVEDQGYLCKKGDFHRIPANKVHWAWNRSQSDAVVVESHSPPLGRRRDHKRRRRSVRRRRDPEPARPGRESVCPLRSGSSGAQGLFRSRTISYVLHANHSDSRWHSVCALERWRTLLLPKTRSGSVTGRPTAS